MTVLSNIITPSNVLTTTNTATVTNKTLTSPTVAGMTVSDGTANGVTYLNGSKVLTSGSALTFDGTNLGIATSSPTAKLTISGNQSFVEKTAAYIGVDVPTTSGNGGNFTVRAGAGSGAANTSGNLFLAFGRGNSSATSGYIAFGEGQATNAVGLGVEYMRLDNAGNLGLGVTPSAWNTAGGAALQVKNASLISYANGDVELAHNSFYDGTSYKYIANGFATRYDQFVGTHAWYTAPSGTAGNSVSFTQAMTIDASNSLLVGTTTNPTAGALARGIVLIKQLNDSSQTSGLQIEANANTNVLGLGYNGSTFAIGTTYRSTGSYVPVSFWTGGSERARILSDGDFLFGTTSSPFSSGVGSAFSVQSNGRAVLVMRTNSTSTSTLCDFGNPNSTIGTIQVSGTSTSFNTSSDYRLKEDVQPMTGALAKVVQLKPVTYKWKTDGTDGQGFIAHELAEVVPQCVTGEKDAINADGKPIHQGVDTSFLVATLTAAIQEQQAIIESLKARLDAANL